ncbi:MAG: hypothetical protein DMG24_21075, partial [Acidobacteria bacterium]
EVIVNNTLFDNLSGAIVVGNDVSTDDYTAVNNNIAYNNTRGISEEGTTGTHNVYQNNLVGQNSQGDWLLQNGLMPTGTVSANPQFVNYTGDSKGDYHLKSTSPAIDAGTSNDAPAYDYDGNSRPQGSAWDMGAYEFAGSSSVSLSPASLTFGSQTVGTASASQTVTLANRTGASLSISSIAISGGNSADFSQSNTCGRSVAAGASCSIAVTFQPTAAGARSSTLAVTDNASSAPLTVPLAGRGTDFSISAASGSPTSATVAPGQTATYTLEVTGTAGFSGTVELACEGAPQAATCTVAPNSVAANGTTPVSVEVKVATTASSRLSPPMRWPPAWGGPVLRLWFGWLFLFAMLAGATLLRRRAWSGYAVVLLAMLLWSSCGGGGSARPPSSSLL